MSKSDLKVDWATHEAAKYACEHWHYSKSLPKSKLVKVGAWESGKFIGVVIFGYGATPNLSKPYGLKIYECAELVRIAITNHVNPVSRIIKLSLIMLKTKCPLLRLIVSYADTMQGHHGGIYQATNWTYSGKTQDDVCYRAPDGKLWHRRRASKHPNNQKQLVTKDWTTEIQKGKHRYLMPLDPEMRAKIAPLAKPYPKRPKQAMTGDHPAQRQCDTDQDAPYSALSAVSG